MNSIDAIRWFKTNFQEAIEIAVAGTPFTVNFVTAIACQETGYIWQPLADRLPPGDVLKLCVGDTIGAPRRGAFPATKDQLLRASGGPRMFTVAREALQTIAAFDAAYAREFRNPDEFCHGFGIFQYDLQFFLEDPDFFLKKQWADFDACLARFLKELKDKLRRVFGSGKTSLTRREMASVAIAYNHGSYRKAAGLRQGHRDQGGEFYGEKIFAFLGEVEAVTVPRVVREVKKRLTPRKSRAKKTSSKTKKSRTRKTTTTTRKPTGTTRKKARRVVKPPQPRKPRTPKKKSPAAGAEAPVPHALPVATLRHGDKGALVKVLQTLLQSQGYFSGAIGGNFLEKTHAAVVYFQQTHLGPNGSPLEVNGEVGEDTWWALYNPSGDAQKSHLPSEPSTQLTPMRAKVLEVATAEHQAGVCEVPDGSNWGDGVIKYLQDGGSAGNPWCCFFWSWCVKNATGEYPFGRAIGLVQAAWSKANDKGWAREKSSYSPIPGDAFVLLHRNRRGQRTGTGHIGFVLRVDRTTNARSFNTVEGNCGNRVKVGLRQMDESTLVGFINQYPPEEQPTDWKPGLVAGGDVSSAGTR